MPKYDVVEDACKYCWGKPFMNEFQDFFDRYANQFIDAPPKPTDEQNLEYYELYQKYLRLFEANLSDYIATLKCTDEEFMEQLIAVQEDADIKDKKLKHFVNYLIASTDYASFYKIMLRAAKKLSKADEKSSSSAVDGVDSLLRGGNNSDAKSTTRTEEKSYK